MELFSKFIKEEFPHLFVHDIEQAGCQKTLSTGEEFISFFVSQLYCRVFIANQTIVKTGEQFAEMYMIFKGRVTLSLRVKDENEYFTLYSTNYFGDYQILMGLRSSECYKSSVDSQTYCHCLKKKELLDLMGTFPTARYIFTERAIQRRLEFRRIKKQYEIFADVHPNPEIDAIQITDASRFTIQTYNDKSKESEMPPFLTDPDFYFAKSELVQVKNEDVQEISDSEVQTRLTQDDIEEKQKERTKRSLDYLMKQIDLTNQALVQVKNKLSENAEKTVDFIDRINSGQDHVEIPTIDNLQNCLNELHAALPHFTAKS